MKLGFNYIIIVFNNILHLLTFTMLQMNNEELLTKIKNTHCSKYMSMD
jgi:hypothetical protein